MEFRGKVKNGVVVFEVPPPLVEGTEVTVRAEIPKPVAANGETDAPPQTLLEWAGCVEGPSDWAAEHNHYIHGTPKRRP